MKNSLQTWNSEVALPKCALTKTRKLAKIQVI